MLGTFRTRVLIAGIPLIFLLSARPARGCFSAQPNRRAPLASTPVQQDRVAELRSRFDKESDPVRKSKLMVQLGAAEFDDMEKRLGASDSAGALGELRSYQDQANSCEKALDARGVDPEKHPAGYKELQVSVREALRRLDNFMINMTGDEQQPFREIRKNLDNLDQDLIKELFPKRPASGPGSGKSNN